MNVREEGGGVGFFAKLQGMVGGVEGGWRGGGEWEGNGREMKTGNFELLQTFSVGIGFQYQEIYIVYSFFKCKASRTRFLELAISQQKQSIYTTKEQKKSI